MGVRNLRKRRKKFLAAFLSFLIVFSTFISDLHLVSASTKTNPEVVTNELTESERESLFNEKENPQTFSDQNELATLLSGLGWKPKLDSEEGNLPAQEPQEKIDSAIYEELKEKDKVDVIIKLKDKQDMEEVFQSTKSLPVRSDRIEMVQEKLMEKSNVSQKGLQQALQSLEQQGKATIKKSFWINNSILANVDSDTIEQLKQRDDIEEVILDAVLTLPEIKVEESKPKLPEWGLEKIRAPKVWGEYGLKGEGIVVGIMDTGVDGTHEALRDNYRGRDGNHQYSWIDLSGQNYATPSDGQGHGTHVAGTAVGGGSGEPIGVAPGAEWIAAKIFNDGGSTTLSAIHSAFEWFMAPGGDPSMAPHIVNNSWGNSNPYNTEFYEDVQAWISVGIFPMFAGGNDGPATGTIGSPGSFPESFTIGATDIYDYAAYFSSRGPVYWPDENGEMQLVIKPNISAPGHQIYSAYPAQLGKGKYAVLSGTSMATPHATGAVALLLSANPNLTINDIKNLLIDTARVEPHMGQLPNSVYGSGIIDIYQAVTETAYAGIFKGTVNTQTGEPLEASIQIIDEDLEITSEQDGSFEHKVKAGTYTVKVQAFGYETFETQITITKDQITEIVFQLNQAETFSVSGKILNKETGDPVKFAYVQLKNTPLSTIRTGTDGTFHFDSVPVGQYEIQISGEGIQGTKQTLEVNENVSLNIEVLSSSNQGRKDWKTANGHYDRNSISSNTIDAEKLQLEWEYETGSKGEIVFSTPAATDEQIILTTENGWVVSLDAVTGEEQWSVRVGNSNRSTPTIENESVYLSGGSDGLIYSLDLETGMIQWNKHIGQPAVYESPIYHNGILYVGSGLSENPKLFALNAATGDEVWSINLGASSFGNGALGDDYLYIGTYENRSLRAVIPETGEIAWTQTVSGVGFASKPVYQDGVVYAIASNFDNDRGILYAFDGTTGALLWQVDDIGNSEFASPIVYENFVIASSAATPMLRAFDKTTGEEIWANSAVGSSLNSGSVSANGILFIAGTNSNFMALDVYTGEVIKQFSMPAYSTSGLPITSGKVIVPNLEGIQSYVAAGTLKGKLSDVNGAPIEGNITILETGRTVQTNDKGEYELSHSPGTYTLRVSSYGYRQITEEVTFESGFSDTKNYRLEDGELASLVLTIKDQRTSLPLNDVSIVLEGTPILGTSDENGQFSTSVVEGTYEATIILDGYAEQVRSIEVIANHDNAIEILMQPYDIAVLNDWNGEITKLLNEAGYLAVERDWDVVDSLDRYEILYLNGSYTSTGWQPDEATFNQLLDAANANDVDIVFADTWGSNYGSIEHLVNFKGDPSELSQRYGGGSAFIEVTKEHPIFNGYSKGDLMTLIFGDGDFTWFNGYSGINLGKIGSDKLGLIGTGVAYKPVSEDSAHVLLSAHSASPWVSPSRGWSEDMVNILLNSIQYLQEAKFGKVTGTITNSSGEPVEAKIEVVEESMILEDSSQFELYLDEGEYTIKVQSAGYETKTETIVVSHNQPTQLQVQLTSTEGSSVTGSATDSLTGQALATVNVSLLQDGNLMYETVTDNSGHFELLNIIEGTYTLLLEKDGYIQHKEEIEVLTGAHQYTIELTPTPRIAVLEDYSTNRNFKKLFEDAGIPVTQLTTSNLLENIAEFDVIFLNEYATSLRSEEKLNEILFMADQAQTSLIFGDDYYTSSPIQNLVNIRQDPTVRDRVSDRNATAGYIIQREHPIFKDREIGDFIDIRYPSRSRLAYFQNYSGYPLATISHSDTDSYGLGMAYKPRTSGSTELLMSGHAFSIGYYLEHYTETGKQLLIDAAIWAAYAEFPTIYGTVTDSNGNPLPASIQVIGESFSGTTEPTTGEFSIAIEGQEYEIEVSAFGYESQTISVTATQGGEPLNIVLTPDASVGAITGTVENEQDGFAISDVDIQVLNFPRNTVTNTQGAYSIDLLMPGTYTLVLTKEGFVEKTVDVEVNAGETTQFNILLKPSPRIGVIGDYNSAGKSMKEYLNSKGYIPEDLSYFDLDKVSSYDLIIANSDYTSDKKTEPEKNDFDAFTKALDEAKVPIIWTGHVNDRGGIRFLNKYENNPSIIVDDRSNNILGRIIKEHPITSGLDVNSLFPINDSTEYYGFDGYDGTTVAQIEHGDEGRLGSMIAYKGRTLESVEILMANFTFGYYYNPTTAGFNPERERILENAITWALDNQEPLVGELHGQIINDQDMNVPGSVKVLETGKIVKTDDAGNFYLGLQEGTYTLQLEAFGHDANEYTVQISNGEILEQDFTIASHDLGTIQGTIADSQTGEPIAGANIAVLNTPLAVTTNENGSFTITAPVGNYDLRVASPGYSTQVLEDVVVTRNETTEASFYLQVAENIAVIATTANATRISNFLTSEGYEADYFTNADLTPLIDGISEYSLIIFNEKQYSTTEEQFKTLIEKADEQEVSIIFTSQFSGGTIRELRDIYEDPQTVSWNFVPEYVSIKVLNQHPIFAGIEGEEFRILNKESNQNQQYAIYNGYSGTTIGKITHGDQGELGDGIGYQYRTANSVHLLLSSLQVGSYADPSTNWTNEAKIFYTNAIEWAMRASLGEITGTVTDHTGNPIQGATVSIPSIGITTATNAEGEYRISTGTGQYEVRAVARGFHEQLQTVEILEQGQSVVLNFSLQGIEGTSISGTVVNATDQNLLSGAEVTLLSLEDNEEMDTLVTDNSGSFSFSKLLPGNYLVKVTRDGFIDKEMEVTITDEPVTVEVALHSIDVAVIGDHNQKLSEFLNSNQIYAESVDWSVLEKVQNYKLIIVNSNSGTKEQINTLIGQTDENETSLVFLGTWGVNEGSIHLLEKAVSYPERDQQGYNEGSVTINATSTHPIFEGLSDSIIVHSEGSPYSSFKNYPGVTLGNIEVDNENKGTAIAYEYRSAKSIHLLLSSFAVTNMIGPDYGWTEEGKTLFLNATHFAMNAEQIHPVAPTFDQRSGMSNENKYTITGSANEGDTIRLYEVQGNKTTVLSTTIAKAGGTYSFEYEFTNGSHLILAEAENYLGKERTTRPFKLIITGKPNNYSRDF